MHSQKGFAHLLVPIVIVAILIAGGFGYTYRDKIPFIPEFLRSKASGAAWVELVRPNGGEKWGQGKQVAITWNKRDLDPSYTQVLWLKKNGVGQPPSIASNLDYKATMFSWTIPSNLALGNDYAFELMVLDASNNLVTSDFSNENFSIVAPKPLVLKVMKPNGGETWKKGKTKLINWNSRNLTGNVSIFYTRSAPCLDDIPPCTIGVEQTLIAQVPASLGKYSWTIPNSMAYATNYRIVISSDNEGIVDRSDANFIISVTGE